LLCSVSLGFVLWRRDGGTSAAKWEGWAWFLSPLMLLPAIPVVLAHGAWKGNHEDLLPVVLFGALISEVLFSQALRNVPDLVGRLWERFLAWDRPDPGTAPPRLVAFLKRHAPLLTVVVLALAYGAFMSF